MTNEYVDQNVQIAMTSFQPFLSVCVCVSGGGGGGG